MYKKKTISLILPAYNEEESITRMIDEFADVGVVDEIIVVDNNSKDNTVKLAKATGKARVVREKRQGYGYALRKGLSAAKGDLLILCDCDNTYRASDIKKLLAQSDDFDCVFATRTKPKYNLPGSNMGWLRRNANIAVAKLIQALFNGPNMTDPGATFRLLDRKVYETIKSYFTVGGIHFQPELTILSILNGFKIAEVPVYYAARTGESKISGPFFWGVKTAIKMVGVIFSYRIRTMLGKLRIN